MTIYTVQPGDTIDTIASRFHIPSMRLIHENNILPDYKLVVGQNLVLTYPDRVYHVIQGDTIQSIADAFGISVLQLLQNNPQLSNRAYLYIDEEIIISFPKEDEIEVNGYTFSYVNLDTLRKTLPYLTYLTIASYRVIPSGDIIVPDDETIINIAKEYGVATIMFLSSFGEQGQGSYGINHIILNDEGLQDKLIKNIIFILRKNGLNGVNFGFEYILKDDMQNYLNFIAKAKSQIQNEDAGYVIHVSCLPELFGYNPNGENETSYFYQVGQIADRVILISYQWAYSYILTVEQTTVKFLEKYLQFVLTQIPSEKILIGFTRIAYDWELPYVENESPTSSLGILSAIELARDNGVNILFDEETQTPYFYYTNFDIEHFVWFKDVKSVNSILGLVKNNNLKGIAIWNIMYYTPSIWTVINSQYNRSNVLKINN